ncbi:MAG: hypothetical protein D4R80_00990 [Deltaproteobacteria bacterium]|nr:MAG: hypothetical protein D4R80_00990 [Deltaproteobacteria bacterium]
MGNRVMTTSNYDLFQEHQVNRTVQEGTATYNRLEGMMLKYGWMDTEPMIVYPKNGSGKHTIVKGHNRFNIARKHKIPIKFQIDDLKIPIHEREDGGGRPTWTLEDWVVSRARENKNPNYQTLVEYQRKTSIPMSTCIYLFHHGGSGGSGGDARNSNQGIKDGSFDIPNPSHAEAVGNLIMYCSSLDISYSTKAPFVRTIAQIIRTKVVDINELAKRIRKNIGIMKRKYYVPNYLGILTEVYNYRSSPKIDLATEVRNALDAEKKETLKKATKAGVSKRKAA